MKTNPYDHFVEMQNEMRKAKNAYTWAKNELVEAITKEHGWPCTMEDPVFVNVDSKDGPVLIELKPSDNPRMEYMPFRVHTPVMIELKQIIIL